VEGYFKWSAKELAAWAGTGRLVQWLQPRIRHAIPWDGAVSADDWSLLENILNAAWQFRTDLVRLFAATALLTPPPEKQWNIMQLLFPEAPLTDWLHAAWRLVSIPCVGDDGPTIITLMCGHSTETLSGVESANLSTETIQAIGMAASLATRKWGGHFVCWHWSERTGIRGASLGLPVFLGFGCAAEKLPLPRALATGKLDASGSVEPVENVAKKVFLAGDRSLFVPEANYSAALPACIPVSTIEDAWDLWKSCGTANSPDHLRTLVNCLDEPKRLFAFLLSCSEAEVGFLDTDVHVARIQSALEKSPFPVAALRLLLVEMAISREGGRRRGLRFVLKIFPRDSLHRVADSAPALAWRLAMLHLRALNHSGHPKEAAEVRETARRWENALDSSDSEEELIAHSLAIVGLLHNTYRFGEDPRKALGPSLSDLLLQAERRVAQGKKRNKPLGDWYGTLAQHHAFRGELSEAEEHLEKAMTCFEGRPEDQRQSLSYRFFARLDARKSEALDDLLAVLGVERLDEDLPKHIQRIDNTHTRCWALFALARFAVDSKTVQPALQTMLAGVSEHLANNNRIWGMTPVGHPWQLILFNLGFLARKNAEKEQLWRKSLDLCLNEKSGPAIRVMSLLPLSAIKSHGLELPRETENIVSQIRRMIREDLDILHFSPVLTGAGWADVLDRVTKHRNELFPFNYR